MEAEAAYLMQSDYKTLIGLQGLHGDAVVWLMAIMQAKGDQAILCIGIGDGQGVALRCIDVRWGSDVIFNDDRVIHMIAGAAMWGCRMIQI